MSKSFASKINLSEFSFWEKTKNKRLLLNLELEITARCNFNCRHCYINLPAGDSEAEKSELSREEINSIAEDALELGGFWCLITGGEPLLRRDFPEIYIDLKRKGLLVSVFTNAALINDEHIRLFKKYPPREIEISVYAASQGTYDKITRKKGSYKAFTRGLNLLEDNNIPFRLKAMALKSNIQEISEFSRFCWEKTRDYFRFDPFLHLRYDGDPVRNEEIKSERLNAGEINYIERNEVKRSEVLKSECRAIIAKDYNPDYGDHIFSCSAGFSGATISYDGIFRLCATLWHKDCIYDLRIGKLKDAWNNFVPRVLAMRSSDQEFLTRCQTCKFSGICYWCPAIAHLETGRLDQPVEEFCHTAHERVKANTK